MFLAGTAVAETFVDATAEAGLGYLQRDIPDPQVVGGVEIMTGGAAVADYDGDGWPDLFVTRIDNTDILFRNQGDGTFEDVSSFTENAPTNGVAWGDIDNDGDQDLLLSTVGTAGNAQRYFLYANTGNGSFVEQAHVFGADLTSATGHRGFSISLGDYDRNGWLDIHTCEWVPAGGNARSVLLGNSGSPPLSDVTESVGVEMWHEGADTNVNAFSSRLCDMDNDGWPDLVVAADFGTSRLFWNNRDGTFTDGTAAAGVGGDENGMGLTIGDYDGDGFFDIFVTSIYDERDVNNLPGNWGGSGNRLYRNRGDRTFEDATDAAGVRDGGWGWAAVFFDYDNDADLDLLMTNGFVSGNADSETPFHTDPTKLWRNDGGVFTDVSVAEGFTDTASGKGALVFDYDRDGDLDVFIANNASQPNFYKNTLDNGNSWLRVRATGTVSNRDGIGARVTVTPGNGSPAQVREVSGGSQYLAHDERICHFGLGDFSGRVANVTILWPSGIKQEYKDVLPNTVLEAVEPPSHYEGWQLLQFTTQELANPSICSALADPDGDRISNVIEFATGLDARTADPGTVLSASVLPGSGLAKITFRRRQFLGEVAIAAEISNDLATWRDATSEFEVIDITTDSSGFEAVTLRSRAPIPTLGSDCFVRLVASIRQ